MGYRSTLISQDYSGSLPDWFKDKWKNVLSFPKGIMIVSTSAFKIYDNDIFEDYQKVLIELDFFTKFITDFYLVTLSEDGYVTKIEITKSSISYKWLTDEGYIDAGGVWCQG